MSAVTRRVPEWERRLTAMVEAEHSRRLVARLYRDSSPWRFIIDLGRQNRAERLAAIGVREIFPETH